MSEWKEYKIGSICKVKGGKRLPKGSNLTSVPNAHPYIRVRDMGSKYLQISNLEYVPNDVFPSIKNYIVDKGDLILSIVGTVGLVSLVNNELHKASLTENCVKILPQKNILNNEYLYYFLKSSIGQTEIHKKIVGAVQPKLPLYNINDILINIPNISIQSSITEILTSLDDKIELNNKINQELESLAQLLFKRWFVDFEFPNENGEPYKSSGGEMVDSELGEIPKGWAVKFLSDVANITIGRTPPRQEHQWFSTDNKDIKWVSIRDMGICGSYIYSTAEYLTKEAVTKFNIPVIKSNTVILSFKLTVGRVSITTEDMLSNEAIAHFNLIDAAIYPELLYLYFKHFNFDSLGSTSSIATAVNSKSIKTMSLIYPASEKLIEFKNAIQPIFSKIKVLTFENKELIELRDTLLPKLISGELQINDN